MNTKLITLSTLIVWPLLGGCLGSEQTIYAICEENPQICSDIQAQGWCKVERANVIRQRQKELTTPNDPNVLYDSLIRWQEFSQCIEIAANIKRRSIKDRDAIKETTFLTTLQEIQRIEQATVNSKLPEFLYYHWAQDGDPSKIEKLVALDQRSKLNTTRLQLMMAAYYGKANRERAISSLYKALQFLKASELESLDPSVYASLATHFYQEKRYKLAFVWTEVATMAGLKTNKNNLIMQNLEAQHADVDKLEGVASDTYNSIRSLAFEAPNNKI